MSAPFVLALAMGALGIGPALWLVMGFGLVAVLAFGAIVLSPVGLGTHLEPTDLPRPVRSD